MIEEFCQSVLYCQKDSGFEVAIDMKWLEIAVETTDAGIEAVSGALMRAGIQNLSIEESHEAVGRFLNEEAAYWDYADADRLGADVPRVLAYVADLPENAEIVAEAKKDVAGIKALDLSFDVGSLQFSVRTVDEEDWANNWKKNYKPLAIGKRLLVVPSWEDVTETGGRKKLVLDPGMAFGTGSLQTTRMCLELLEEAIHEGDELVDLGCGSGILSIAGLLLGASRAVAVDIDPVARDIAAENAQRNGIDLESYSVFIGDVLKNERVRREIYGSYDIVVANIVADVIIALAPFAKRLAHIGAPFITSGIIFERQDDVIKALEKEGFAIERVLRMDDWVAIRARA